MKQIAILLGHPDAASLCNALADAYEKAAEAEGADVRRLNLGALRFDPILHQGYKVVQPLEPDLVRAQEVIRWAQHIVFVYPTWWGSMPALLKGFLDRVMLPGFAFSYRENSILWDRLLPGRTARLLITMDTPVWYYRWVYHAPGVHQMEKCILRFCGIKPVRHNLFPLVKRSTPKKRARWLAKAAQSAIADARD